MLSHTTRRRLTCPVAMETPPPSTMWPLFVVEIIQHVGQSQVSKSAFGGPSASFSTSFSTQTRLLRCRQISEEEPCREDENDHCCRCKDANAGGVSSMSLHPLHRVALGHKRGLGGRQNRLKTSYFCRNDTAAPLCPKRGAAVT